MNETGRTEVFGGGVFAIGLAFVAPSMTVVLLGPLAVYYAFNQVAVPVRAPREPEPAAEEGGPG